MIDFSNLIEITKTNIDLSGVLIKGFFFEGFVSVFSFCNNLSYPDSELSEVSILRWIELELLWLSGFPELSLSRPFSFSLVWPLVQLFLIVLILSIKSMVYLSLSVIGNVEQVEVAILKVILSSAIESSSWLAGMSKGLN
jgi:hypothetical protein